MHERPNLFSLDIPVLFLKSHDDLIIAKTNLYRDPL